MTGCLHMGQPEDLGPFEGEGQPPSPFFSCLPHLSDARPSRRTSIRIERGQDMFVRTDRLLLRPGWPEDAPALAAAIGEERIVRKLATAPWP